MSDFNIQRFNRAFGSSSDISTPGITVGSLDYAFARLSCMPVPTLIGVTTPSGASANNDDLSCTCYQSSTSLVTLERQSTGNNVDHTARGEVWEYTGLPNGINEMKVLSHGNVTVADPNSSGDSPAESVTVSTDKLVPVLCGASNAHTGREWDRAISQVDVVNTSGSNYVVRGTRGDTTTDSIFSYALLHFLGSNWKVEKFTHTFGSAGVIENLSSALSVATGPWSTKFIISTTFIPASGGTNMQRIGAIPWPKVGDDTDINMQVHSSNPLLAGTTMIGWVIENPLLSVTHRDTITGVEAQHPFGTTEPQFINLSITTPADLAHMSTIAHSFSTGANENYPESWWGWDINAANNLRWTNLKHGQRVDWALQLIDWTNVVPAGGGGSGPGPILSADDDDIFALV